VACALLIAAIWSLPDIGAGSASDAASASWTGRGGIAAGERAAIEPPPAREER